MNLKAALVTAGVIVGFAAWICVWIGVLTFAVSVLDDWNYSDWPIPVFIFFYVTISFSLLVGFIYD